mgnify:CR=1 FL=1
MRSKHAGELAALRDEVSRLELRLAEERRERKTVEDQVTQAHSEHHSKARDLEGEGSSMTNTPTPYPFSTSTFYV